MRCDRCNSDKLFRPEEQPSRAPDRAPSQLPNDDQSTDLKSENPVHDGSGQATVRLKPTCTSPGSDSSVGSPPRKFVRDDNVDGDPSVAAECSPTSNGAKDTTTESSGQQERRPSHGGIGLNDFTKQAQFVPTFAGLGGLKDDLETNPPLTSRPAGNVHQYRTPSSHGRALNLPTIPKPIVPPPDDCLDKPNLGQYIQHMQTYMSEWNGYNAKMMEHFHLLQVRVSDRMSRNWIGQSGDGPDAEVFDTDEKGDQHAGYAAYMQWLRDDKLCRYQWKKANETHLTCMDDLGRIRDAAKKKLLKFA